jgi:hypothetical protein
MVQTLSAIASILAGMARADSTPLRAQVLSVPSQLLQSPAPLSLVGVVEGAEAGHLWISTSVGEVQLRAPTDLAVGRAVTIVTRPAVPTEVFILPSAMTGTSNGPAVPVAVSSPTAAPIEGGSSNAAGAGATLPGNRQPMPATAPEAGRNVAATAGTQSVPSQAPSAPQLAPEALMAALASAPSPDPVGAAVYGAGARRGWGTDLLALLTDIRRLVAARNPRLVEQLQRRLPIPDQHGAPAALALPVAAQHDRLAHWVGREIASALEEERGGDGSDILARLGAALNHVDERLEKSDEQAWRWRQLPLDDNGHLMLLAVGVAPQREQIHADGRGGSERHRHVEFAVEVTLSALGRTRIDAIYRGRRLDLLVQCETAFLPDDCARIAAAASAALAEFGLSGSCRFAPYRDHPSSAVKV